MVIELAYIDPGSGSLLVQALIAAVVAAPFVFRREVGNLVRRVRGIGTPITTEAPPVNRVADADTTE